MRIIELGLTDFLEAYEIQSELVKKVSQGLSDNTLLITEHRPVITIGRRGSQENILKTKEFLSSHNIEIVYVARGGDVTYHGPGQIIAYPIFKLENEGRDIHRFLDFLEEVGRHFLEQYGLLGERRPGFRGIWIDGKKIGSLGIGVKRWVTYHGLAINVNTDLTPFSFIRPCGIKGAEISSLKNLLGYDLEIRDAKDRLEASFKKISLLAEAVSKS
ncbi:lipoyl(octanoyl) transferase LipB [Candidatus Omnitrophota bacterium]